MNFVKDIYTLDAIKRYSTSFTHVQESVASHSFFVAALVMHMAEDYKFDVPSAVCMALCHDMPEIELNDIPRPIKLKYPKLREIIKEHENEIIKEMPTAVRLYLRMYRKGNSVESSIVKLCDTYQCVQFANNEIALGNADPYIKSVVDNSYKIIHELTDKLEEYKHETN